MIKKFGAIIISFFITIAIALSSQPKTTYAGNNFSEANNLELNKLYSEALETEDDVNFYKFTTSNNDSFYKIELRNTEVSESISLTLYSEDDPTTNVYDLIVYKATAKTDTKKLEH
ncbi:MAG: hypothetical protein GX285_05390, partial [Clostridiales bacterium]|nr:hypothetical protein [Clostridiales bacterium]